MSFNFGATTLPSATTASTATAGAGDAKAPPNKPLTNLFATPTTSAGFFMGTPPKTTAPAVSFGVAATTSAPATPGFTLTPASSAPAATTTPQFSLATAAPATAASFTPIFSTVAATSAPPKQTTTTAAATFTGLRGLAPATTAQAATAATTAATTTAPAATAGSLTYAQLEDSINKWTIDLEEQGKFFINQAKQLNAWDNLLVSNSDKILALNETIERVKQQQKQLDQELDFVLAQQNELDELSLPLEKQLADIPVTDQNRFQTYQLSEIIDSQLKQMSEDLKEIVEHLNESNKDEDIADPVIQVSRILNAHMNSLQWIDRQTSQIGSHLEQVSQLHETYKKNHLNL